MQSVVEIERRHAEADAASTTSTSQDKVNKHCKLLLNTLQLGKYALMV